MDNMDCCEWDVYWVTMIDTNGKFPLLNSSIRFVTGHKKIQTSQTLACYTNDIGMGN